MPSWKTLAANRRVMTIALAIATAYECYVATTSPYWPLRAGALFVALGLTALQILNFLLWRELDRHRDMAEHFKKVEEFFDWLKAHAEPVTDDADASDRPNIH